MPKLMEEREKRISIVYGVVLVLGIISISCAVAAQQLATTIDSQHCIHRTSPPVILGFTATFALSIAHIIIIVEVGCCGCRHTPRPSISTRTLAICVLSWLLFPVAQFSLLTGAVFSVKKISDSCYEMNFVAFFLGGVLSSTSINLAAIGYDLFNSENTASSTTHVIPPNHDGIELGQPQFPAPTDSCFRA